MANLKYIKISNPQNNSLFKILTLRKKKKIQQPPKK